MILPQTAIKNQMLAALATLNQCIEDCPGQEWNEAHGDAPFSQVLFHTLFCLDYYLTADDGEFKSQPFHLDHRELFRNYEELEDHPAEQLYRREEITRYHDFCRDKIAAAFDEQRDLLAASGRRGMTLLELALYNTRHVQHHAAQLGLRLQQLSGRELKWIAVG